MSIVIIIIIVVINVVSPSVFIDCIPSLSYRANKIAQY